MHSNINQYIQNSMIRGRLCKWGKTPVNVFITPVSQNTGNKDFLYSQIEKAMLAWNVTLKNLSINLQFQKTEQVSQADIVVHWVKVGRTYEGMCKYLCVVGDEIRKIAIDIGLENEFSGKNTTDISIYCAIMHEFGHALGLGHGVDVNDIMYVPHQKSISQPSENDIYVLKKIYLNINDP